MKEHGFLREFDKLQTMGTDPLLTPLPDGHRKKIDQGSDLARILLDKTDLPQERIESQYTLKIEHKSLLLHPATKEIDTRAIKAEKVRLARLAKRKPRPLSAKEKRKIKLYDVPSTAQFHSLYLPLNKLWTGYMNEILSTGGYEPKLLKADYHGAWLKVTKSSCPGTLFLEGIVIKETRHTFVISTPGDEMKTIPKRCKVFEFRVKLDIASQEADYFTWEVFGEHFGYRAAERVGKKFKGRSTIDF